MTSLIGNTFLCMGLVFVVLSTLFCYQRSTIAIPAIITQSILTTLSFLTLVFCFYISDFSVQNVFLHSSDAMPVLFKISGAWASHEGSMLLWYTLLSIMASICILNLDPTLMRTGIFIVTPILLGFGVFVYYASNPFTQTPIDIPHQGMGLNPLLQDIGLSIHPPILYVGYVTYLAPFVYSCLALLYPHKAQDCMRISLTFSKFGWLMLTMGVGLGSWWAYRELGWGGFWFFDPVENISLMPLIAAIAFHHSLMFSISHAKLMKWTIFLGLTTFLLTILGTFLVRSGLLSSVHSFTNNSNRTQILFWIFAMLAVFSYSLYVLRVHTLSSNKPLSLSKEQGVLFANITWIIVIITLLFALIYPIISGLLGVKISVGDKYFISTFIPFVLPTLLLAGSFAYFKTKHTITPVFAMVTVVTVIIVTGITYYKLENPSIITIIALLCSIFLMLSTIVKLLEKSHYFTLTLSSKMTAMLIGHFGYGLMVLSIALNSAIQSEFDFIGKIGDRVETKGYKIILQNLHYSQHENYYRQIAEFWIENSDREITILRPENRFYEVEKAITAESDTYSYLTHDLYAILSKVDDNIIHAKIYYRPCIGLLWISLMVMVGGIIVTLSSRSISRTKHNNINHYSKS